MVHKLHTLAITWISNQVPLKNINMIEFKNFDMHICSIVLSLYLTHHGMSVVTPKIERYTGPSMQPALHAVIMQAHVHCRYHCSNRSADDRVGHTSSHRLGSIQHCQECSIQSSWEGSTQCSQQLYNLYITMS